MTVPILTQGQQKYSSVLILETINENRKRLDLFNTTSGLMLLLMVIVVGDFYVALKEHRPVDESVINLLQMAVTGVIGIIAGYLSGKEKI